MYELVFTHRKLDKNIIEQFLQTFDLLYTLLKVLQPTYTHSQILRIPPTYTLPTHIGVKF